MLRLILSGSAFAAILAGCSAAAATAPDPSNDVHCFVLATGFLGLAQSGNAPANQRQAAAGIEAWYGVRFDAVVKARGKNSVLDEASRVAKFMDADFPAAKTAYLACTNRAVSDPAFNDFAAKLHRQ